MITSWPVSLNTTSQYEPIITIIVIFITWSAIIKYIFKHRRTTINESFNIIDHDAPMFSMSRETTRGDCGHPNVAPKWNSSRSKVKM